MVKMSLLSDYLFYGSSIDHANFYLPMVMGAVLHCSSLIHVNKKKRLINVGFITFVGCDIGQKYTAER